MSHWHTSEVIDPAVFHTMFLFIESGLLEITGLPIMFARLLQPHRDPFERTRPVLRYYKSETGGGNPMINPDSKGA